jgi:hypothetical protein
MKKKRLKSLQKVNLLNNICIEVKKEQDIVPPAKVEEKKAST